MLRAIHMIRTDVETEVSPAVGGESASEEILGFLLQGFDGDAEKIWQSNIFGKSLYAIASESLTSKLHHMQEPSREKFRLALEKAVNEGSGGMICILF